MIIILDSGIVFTLCTPVKIEKVVDCQKWFERLSARGACFTSSEVCDYEVRRELIRRNNSEKVNKLETLRQEIDFLPLTHEVMMTASKLWATARQAGNPTSNRNNIDVDMILSAQWKLLQEEQPGRSIVIATTNVRHLKLFAEAEEWMNINY